jgi:hypothetical protein
MRKIPGESGFPTGGRHPLPSRLGEEDGKGERDAAVWVPLVSD